MATAFEDTASRLRKLAADRGAVLCMFSGGKDSLIVADLCRRYFSRVVLVHLYFVPGLAIVEKMLADARARWPGIEVYEAPIAHLSGVLKHGLYCFPSPDLPELTPRDVRDSIRRELGVELMMHGAKKSDSLVMRCKISNADSKGGSDKNLVYPIRNWNKYDVLAYLQKAGITPPDLPDVGLSNHFLCWLWDNHRPDFDKLAAFFPFAEAAVKRRDWHGEQYGGKHKIR